MVDTAGTVSFLSSKFKSEGASKIFVCASHGVLSGESIQRETLSQYMFPIVYQLIPG